MMSCFSLKQDMPVSKGMVLGLSKLLIKTAALPCLLQFPNCLKSSLLQLFGEFSGLELRGCELEVDYPNCNICKLLISAAAGVSFPQMTVLALFLLHVVLSTSCLSAGSLMFPFLHDHCWNQQLERIQGGIPFCSVLVDLKCSQTSLREKNGV